MDKIMAFLQGKKVYIVAATAAVYNFGLAMQWWTAESQTWAAVNSLFGFLGLAAFRSAVKKIGNGTS